MNCAEIKNNPSKVRKLQLNTKQCCFFCLRQIVKLEQSEIDWGKSLFQLDSFCRYLKLKDNELTLVLRTLLNGNEIYSPEVEVTLCSSCGEFGGILESLFKKLESIQMEISYYFGKLKKEVEVSRTPEVLQNYSKRMTSDTECLFQLVIVDKLRKEILDKVEGLNSMRLSNPRVNLVRTDKSKEVSDSPEVITGSDPPPPPFKLEVIEEVTSHSDPFDDSKPEDFNPPSPEIDVKFEPLRSSPKVKKKRQYSCKNRETVKNLHYSVTNSGLFSCTKCHKEYTHARTARRHFETVHLNKKFSCDKCNKTGFTQPSHLKRHQISCTGEEKDPEKFKWKCKECGTRFGTSGNLIRHRKLVHEDVRKYPCDLCEKKFQNLGHLKEHKEAVHLRKKFYCRFCNKMYQSRTEHRKHEKCCNYKVEIVDNS